MKESLEKRVIEIFENRFIGFESPSEDARLIVSVIKSLVDDRDAITVNRAMSVLEDARKIIPYITMI